MRQAAPWLAAALLLMLGALLVSERLSEGAGKVARRLGLVSRDGVPTGPLGPAPPTRIGVSLTSVNFYSGRAFANLALGSKWKAVPAKVGVKPPEPETYLDGDGELTRVPPGTQVVRPLVPPDTGSRPVRFRCTYEGRGAISVLSPARMLLTAPSRLEFTWTTRWPKPDRLAVAVRAIDPADPLRHLDCREAALPADTRFAPAFLKLLADFKVLRFMDWQRTNASHPISWATRHTLRSNAVYDGDGISIEDMVALVRATGADMWVCVPWNADVAYVAGFARLVHDTVPADRTVYVELSNEVWNRGFRAAQQARREGLERGLADDPGEAGLKRYAERLAEVMDVWTAVFADRPQRLVRVAATQHVVPARGNLVLGYRDTAAHVDALATAPYFGLNDGNGAIDSASALAMLSQHLEETLRDAEDNRRVAAKYGKRYLAYEAGQHVVLSDIALAQQVQRSPAMYTLYRRYLDGWRQRIGDTIILFGTSRSIRKSGAFSLIEHDGQTAADSPKLRAVRAELAHP